VLGTSRSDITAPHGPLRAATVQLAALPPEDAQALLEARGVASPERRREIAQAAGGNPLFLEQLHAAGETRSKTSVGLELRALITARLGELDTAQRVTLEAAAVVGQEFWMSGLEALLPETETRQLVARLAELEAMEFIGQGRALERSATARSLSGVFGGEARYSFRHGLIQEGVRRAMSKRRAASLHERFAAFLEEQAGPAAHQYDASIGWHREEAARLRSQLAPTAPTRGEAA
jgi:hypothetical protein